MMPFAACCQTAGNFFFRTMAAPAESPIRAAPTRALEPGSQSQWALIRRRFLRHRVAVASLFLLSVLYVLAAGAEFFAPHSRQWRDLTHAYCPPQLPRFAFEHGLHVRGMRVIVDPLTLKRTYLEDRSQIIELGFFVRGEIYDLWGIIP